MTTIRRSRKALIGLAAFASVAAILPFTNTAQALPPGTPPAGTAVLSPANGTNATSGFQIQLPADTSGPAAGLPARCPGDGVNGHRWHTYIMPITSDPASTVYPGGVPQGPAVTSNLRNPSGTFIRNQLPGTGDGLIAQPPAGYSWIGLGATGVLPAGGYNIGIACTVDVAGVTEVQKFWNTQITVTSTGASTFNYSTGVAPAAPVLSLGAGTGTTQTINFTQAAATPAITSYTLNVTPTPANPLPTVTPGSTSFQLTGLALGTNYSVSLVANNSAGSSPAGTTSFNAAVQTAAPVVTVLDVFDGDDVIVSWTAPAGPVAPASYDVAILQGATTVASQNGVAGLTATFAGLAQGSFTARVTPNYPAGSGVSGQAGTDGFSVNPGALIRQELTVARPAGALILTQRCGVSNALPAYGPADSFPGFPFALPATGATVDQVGTAPIDDATGAGDLEFPNYPLPNDDPDDADDVPFGNVTECGLDMGVARFVTQGNLAGQFFAASGRLNEVTVLDTRDADLGWTLRGDIEDRFTSVSNGDSFSGDYLGWQPVMTDDSDQVGGEGPNGVGPLYNQTVVAATDILPGTGFSTPATGLTDNPVLASAAAGTGLGIATLDARLGLLIPTSVDAADYTATLTLTVA